MNSQIVWREIDLDALARNVRELKRVTRPPARLMAVVKADAYGHGAVEVAKEALKNGAEFLGVARIDEGITLREAGINAPILIFGYTPKQLFHHLIDLNLTQSAWSYPFCKELSEAAISHGKKIIVHLKVDTGMGRLGIISGRFPPYPADLETMNDAKREIESICRLPGLEMEGIFTHFADADSKDNSFTRAQFETFIRLLDLLKQSQIEFFIRHAANSAAIINMPDTHLDMVRAGIALYGLIPSPNTDPLRIDLCPAMSLKTRVIHLKQVPAGFRISYGSTYETKKATIIATIALGYADGFNRLLSSRGYVLIRGIRAPVIGRVCMDLTMCDAGHIPGVCVEDEAVVFGTQGEEMITVDEIADSLNTINYEIVTSISQRVPRVYLRSGFHSTSDEANRHDAFFS